MHRRKKTAAASDQTGLPSNLQTVRRNFLVIFAVVVFFTLYVGLVSSTFAQANRLLSLNYGHVRAEAIFSENLADETLQADNDMFVSTIEKRIGEIRQFPQQCLEMLAGLGEYVLRATGYGEIPQLCYDDIDVADIEARTAINRYRDGTYDFDLFITVMSICGERFVSHSDRFNVAVNELNSRIVALAVLCTAFIVLTLALTTFLAVRSIWREFQRGLHREREQQIRREVAESVVLAERNMIANASHELRTPLNPIIGMTESMLLMRDKFDEKKTKEYLEDILTSARRLLGLIDRMLRWKAQAHDEANALGEFNLWAAVEDALKTFTSDIESKSIRVSNRVDRRHSVLFSSEEELIQVVNNVLSNAVRYNVQGGSIRFEAVDTDDALILDAYNSGIGISDEEADRLLKPFFRSSNALQASTDGTGLGLSIVLSLLEKSGAHFIIKSNPEEPGALATIVFPKSVGKPAFSARNAA